MAKLARANLAKLQAIQMFRDLEKRVLKILQIPQMKARLRRGERRASGKEERIKKAGK